MPHLVNFHIFLEEQGSAVEGVHWFKVLVVIPSSVGTGFTMLPDVRGFIRQIDAMISLISES